MKKQRIETRKTKGRYNTREYRIYYNMMSRCYWQKHDHYINYGGKGIRISDRWFESFENFLYDMGYCPEGYSIDRIDNNGNYCKENCKWSSNIEQASNRSNVPLHLYNGNMLTIAQISRDSKIPRPTLSAWVNKYGLDDESLSKKIIYFNKRKEFLGVSTNGRIVINTVTKEIFPTIVLAAKSIGVNSFYLRSMLTGHDRNKTPMEYYNELAKLKTT